MKLKVQFTSVCKPVVLATAALTLGSANAATWDAGGGVDKNWNSATNWTDDASPAGKAIVFENSGLTTRTDIGNIVSTDISVESLTYQSSGTSASAWQVTEISEGATLTVSGAANPFHVGQSVSSGTMVTKVAIQGGGTLKIDQAGGVISLGNTSNGSANHATTIDLSNLAKWEVKLGNGSFSVGADPRNVTTLLLAADTTLVADTIRFGGGSGNNDGGTVTFNPLVEGDKSIKIRGANDEAVTTFAIAGYTGGATSGKQNGKVDFSGGTVDAIVTNLIIASSQASNANGQSTGELTMDRGTFTAETVLVGQSRTNGNTAGQFNAGTINIHGGEFNAGSILLAERLGSDQRASGTLNILGSGAVTVENGITMGRRTGGTGENPLVATINLDGGSLTVGGDIAKGSDLDAIDASLNLNGGSLDLNGHKIDVDTFTVKSGTLKNLGQFNDGANLAKTTAGTLIISGSNAYTGQTLVEAGSLILNGNLTNSSITVSSGAKLGGKNGSTGGGITLESTASFSFTLDGASDYGNLSAGSIDLGSNANLDIALNFDPVPSQSFTLLSGALIGEFATINGAAIVDNQFTLLFGGESYDFSLSYGAGNSVSIAVVPEPGTLALAGVASAFLLTVYRRRRAVL